MPVTARRHPPTWSPHSWRGRAVAQAPGYPSPLALRGVERTLADRAPLVSSGEVRRLREALGRAARGEGFLLQGGDCAERFAADPAAAIAPTHALLAALAARIEAATDRPTIAVGRWAGQFAKPRTEGSETRHGVSLPAYRGDAVNGLAFEASARAPDPTRMLRGYDHARATLDAVARAGTARPAYASHEALLLPYEAALCRRDAVSGRWYATSAHLLWVGQRTRQLGGAHVEFLRGVANPVGIKIGRDMTPDELRRLLDVLDPHRDPGRTTLICRMGAEHVQACLPPLVRAMTRDAREVLWCLDPMHGNTTRDPAGRKVRRSASIHAELQAYLQIHAAEGSWPGGVHLELTGHDVLECDAQPPADLACDPRLNRAQATALVDALCRQLAAFGGARGA